MRIPLSFLGLIALTLAACQSGPHAGHAGPSAWRSLFDGKTLNGWRNLSAQTVSPGWAVRDGAIARVDKGAGTLITVDQFSDFELAFEWKVAKGSNSGVFYRVSEAGDNVILSPEYQILDNPNHPDGKKPQTTAASNYALYAPARDVTKPVGQWNQGRILVKGNHVEHHLNGVKVVEYELNNPQWKQLVAASKFAKFPNYGQNPRGHIALQDHGDPVWYRNIKVRELNK